MGTTRLGCLKRLNFRADVAVALMAQTLGRRSGHVVTATIHTSQRRPKEPHEEAPDRRLLAAAHTFDCHWLIDGLQVSVGQAGCTFGLKDRVDGESGRVVILGGNGENRLLRSFFFTRFLDVIHHNWLRDRRRDSG